MDRQDVGTASIIRANSRDLPLPDDSVDLVVTSPPYFALRSYQDGGEHYAGQIGDEPTPAEFVASLLEVTRECVRVLKPSGSLWINLGDKYAGSNGQPGGSGSSTLGGTTSHSRGAANTKRAPETTARAKSLIGIPWRFAIACIDDLGLILRAEIIWSKPNGLPESVTDRVRRSHETWFHFTLEPRYYSAVDNIREQHVSLGRSTGQQRSTDAYKVGAGDVHRGLSTDSHNPLGKLPGSVWTIEGGESGRTASESAEPACETVCESGGHAPPSVWRIATQPLRVPESLGIDHFAAFPMEFPRRIIQGWSPRGVCTACGEGRRPVVERGPTYLSAHPETQFDERRQNARGQKHQDWKNANPDTITGEACACPDTTAPTTPGVVLDVFGGTGTTALVAKALGRHGITVDMSADYCRLAQWRTTDPAQLAAAMQVEKPTVQIEGQSDLFDLIPG